MNRYSYPYLQRGFGKAFFLIPAICLVIVAWSLDAPGQDEEDGTGGLAALPEGKYTSLQEGVEPGYDPVSSRNPFLPPGAGADDSLDKLTDEEILVAMLNRIEVKGVIGDDRQTGTVIVGSGLYRIGDEVEVKIGGETRKLEVRSIQLKPLGVLFAYKDEVSVKLIGKETTNEGVE